MNGVDAVRDQVNAIARQLERVRARVDDQVRVAQPEENTGHLESAANSTAAASVKFPASTA